MSSSIAGVLLDVGGTLWPDNWRESEADSEERTARIAAVLATGAERAEQMVRLLVDGGALAPGQITQDTSELVRKTAAHVGLSLSEGEVVAVRRAMCLPAAGRWKLFPGAVELLATIRALHSSCVLLSNGTWRDDECYRRDLRDLGVSRLVDAVVTSVETGLRKPNPQIFELALAAIARRPGDCVMIGDSEENDVLPALALGMRTIRVAIEEDRPAGSAAHAIAASLYEVAEILRSWVEADAAIG